MGGRVTPYIVALTPCGSTVTAHFADSLVASAVALPTHGIRFAHRIVAGCSLLPLARAVLVAQFLAIEDRPTHALLVDSDISWRPRDVVRLLQNDESVVCATYPTKDGSGRLAHMPSADADTGDVLVKVDGAGLGFCLVERQVFLDLIEAFPERRVRNNKHGSPTDDPWLYNLFPIGLDDGQILGEDYGFCALVRSIGHDVWCDPAIQLGHGGMHEYRAAA